MIHFKKNIKIVIYAAGFLIFLFLKIFAQPGEENKNLFLRWEPVQGAAVYRIEIQNLQGEEVLNFESEKNEHEFNLPPGEYRVRIGSVNKFGKVDTWSGWNSLIVKKALTPLIYSVSKNSFITGTIENLVRISGKNIEKNAVVLIKNENTELRIQDINYINSNIINISFNLSEIKPGSYDLFIINPGGLETESPEKIIVTEKPAPAELPADGHFGIFAGYSYTQLMQPWNDVYNNSVTGFNMLIIIDFALINSVASIPVIGNTGIDLEMNYSYLKGIKRTGIIRTDMTVIMSGGNIYCRIPLMGKSSIRIKAGGGISVSEIKEDALYSSSEKFRSVDPYYSAGIYFNFPVYKFLFIETGASYYHILYKDKTLNKVMYSIGLGIIF